MSGQSKRYSILEALVNVLVGYGIATGANWAVLPLFGYKVSIADSAGIGLIMTVVSIVRSYTLRRVFNWWHVRRQG